jgi:7-keto-8-aminopelargonate synthetase-like enzyme
MNMDTMDDELRDIKERNLHRSLRMIGGPQGTELIINGRKMLSFASNNYLGLAHHPILIRKNKEAVEAWGTYSWPNTF